MWGYKPIPAAKSAEDEKKTLDTWAREQDAKPYLRFSTAGSRGADPGELTEAVGDDDAVASTTLGLKNLERVAGMLLPATTAKAGEHFDDLEELYGRDARPVGDRDEPRRGDRRRVQFADRSTSARTASASRRSRATGRSAPCSS